MTISESIQEFLDYCELEKNLSQKTVRMYSYYLRFFLDWIYEVKKNKEVDVIDLKEKDIREFRLYLSRKYLNPHKGQLKRQTQNYFLVALRSLLRHLTKKGHTVISPDMIELGKQKDRTIKYLSEDELKRLFDAVDTVDEMGLRDAAILDVLFST